VKTTTPVGLLPPGRAAFYVTVENDALEHAADRIADGIAEPLLELDNSNYERHAVNAEMTMARSQDGMSIWYRLWQ
jgi:protease-3